MVKKSGNLHGNAPDRQKTVLLVIDMINDLEFKGGEELLADALKVARTLKKLLDRARRVKVPVIYVNDNFGRWQSDFRAQYRHCLENKCRGAPVVELLKPEPSDYYVLKPKHSGFYASPLGLLLEHMGAEEIIFTGLTVESCVYFTASDAYLRDFKITILSDCVVSKSQAVKRSALAIMQESLKAKIKVSRSIHFRR